MLYNLKIFFIFFIPSVLDILNLSIILHCTGYNKKEKPKMIKIFYLIYFFILILYYYANISGNPPLRRILSVSYYGKSLLIVHSYYKGNKNYIMLTLLYISIVAFCGQNLHNIFQDIFPLYADSLLNAVFFDCVATILISAILILIYKTNKKNVFHTYFHALPKKTYFVFFAIIMVLGLLDAIIFRSKTISGRALFVSRILLSSLIILILILLVQILLFNKNELSQNYVIELLNDKMKNLSEYYIEQNTKEKDLRRFKHDSNNLMIILKALISDGNYEKALRYMNHVQLIWDKTNNNFNTGNFICDALLASKSRDASSCDTQIIVDGTIPSNLIDDVDLCILFSNLLDNAIEACAHISGSKTIHINFKNHNETWILTIDNPVEKNVDIINNTIPTSKEEKDQHGLGLQNINQIVKKYNGTINMTCKNLIFTSTIMLS